MSKTISTIIVPERSRLEKKLVEKILSVSNPSLHAFTLHDIRNDRKKTVLYVALLSSEDVLGYILIYKGINKYHSTIIEPLDDVYGEDVVRELVYSSEVAYKGFTGTIHVDEKYMETVTNIVEPSSVYFYHIMEYTGSPPTCNYNKYNIIELDYGLLGRYKASYEIARRIKGLRKAYGVVLRERVVGVGGFYVMEPEVYLVGGIYVEPEYRGRGIGKTISCFLTKKALENTGRVVLWVNTENYPAIHIYRSIGYKVIRVNAWINVNVNVRP